MLYRLGDELVLLDFNRYRFWRGGGKGLVGHRCPPDGAGNRPPCVEKSNVSTKEEAGFVGDCNGFLKDFLNEELIGFVS